MAQAKKVAAKKTVAKKAPAKKVAAKKAAPAKKVAAKKAAPAKKVAAKKAKKYPALDLKPIKTKLNRAGLVAHIAELTEFPPKQVRAVIDTLPSIMKACVMPKGCGVFAIPGVLQVKTKKVPAQKGGKKVMSFGVERITKAKPATVKVRARALGSLKRAALGTE